MPPKRKSDASVSSSSKKQRREDDNARAVTLVDNILANLDGFSIPENDTELREDFVSLAKYARYLQEQGGPTSTATARVKKSPDELEAAVEKVRKAAVAGIKKQMNWRPTCKSKRAKWSYDGICNDEDVFAALFGFPSPVKFKQKKMTVEEFENHMGGIRASARYSNLYLTGDSVNIRWSETGEFKLSGTYGV